MIKLKVGKHLAGKTVNRLKKKMRIRKKVEGTTEKPRLTIFRSSRHIYAQLIDDATGKTLASTSTQVLGTKLNKETAVKVGQDIAAKAKGANISEVVFDRNGYIYHGRVKALADAAREAGLKF